jgi:pimeloyl-ACP methyl ester carboxylesterase
MSNWVFLRGLMRETRHWGAFPDVFRAMVPDADVHLLNLPGNGRLHAMRSPSRIEEMSNFCRSELLARGIPPPYHLLALSLGAMVATAWAADHPEEIRGCVLINTSLRPFSPFHHRLRPCNYSALLRVALGRRDALRQERLILSLTSNAGVAQTDVLAEWIRFQQECPVTYPNALRQLLAAVRYRAPETSPSPPLLLLCSGGDRLVDPRCSQRLAHQWRAPLATHPTAGHDLTLDDNRWAAEHVRDWLCKS